jgi:Tfp pilus assembly protein PilZ
MDDLGIGVRFAVRARDVSLLHSVYIEFLAHPALYAMGNGSCFLGRGMNLTIHLHAA